MGLFEDLRVMYQDGLKDDLRHEARAAVGLPPTPLLLGEANDGLRFGSDSPGAAASEALRRLSEMGGLRNRQRIADLRRHEAAALALAEADPRGRAHRRKLERTGWMSQWDRDSYIFAEPHLRGVYYAAQDERHAGGSYDYGVTKR